MIMYVSCLIIRASKVQYLIALSNTEAGYIAPSTALSEVIVILNLL